MGGFLPSRLRIAKGYATVLATTAPVVPKPDRPGEDVDMLETTAGHQTISERTIAAERRMSNRAREKTRNSLLAFDTVATFALIVTLNGIGLDVGSSATSWSGIFSAVISAAFAVMLIGAVRAYDPMTRLPGARSRTCGQLALVGCATAVFAAVTAGGFDRKIDVGNVLALGLALSVSWIAARVVAATFERHHPAPTLIVGTGDTARRVWELSLRHHECALEVLGFVDDKPLDLPAGAPATLGSLADLPRLVTELEIERVIVAYTNIVDYELLRIIRALDGRARVEVVPRLYELVQARGFELGRISLLNAGGIAPSAGEQRTKRAFDIIVASLMLVLLAPVLVAIALAVKIDSRGPILFRQRRVGKHCRAFDVLKFRTMAEGAEQHGHDLIQGMAIEDAVHELKSRSAERHVTRPGRLLRSTSLDELPQLWNVIRGDMGLVGPRPLREYEIAALDEWQVATRQAVLPGITGLWQVSGRSSVSWEERLHLDCVYARHWSLTSDLRILARTFAVVFHRSDTV